MRKLLTGCFIMLLAGMGSVQAQQDPHFTQHFDNMLFLNPAYAGSNQLLNMTLLHREQWVGFEGRPRSTTFSVHSPLPYRSVGVGLTVVNDKVGPMNQTMFYGDVSYTLRFKNSLSQLSFGVKGGLNLVNIDYDILNPAEDDPNLLQSIRNRTLGNVGAGIYYHLPYFFVGFSIPKILQQSYDKLSETNVEQRHYFASIGGVITLADRWKLRPAGLLKMTVGAPVSIDLSVAAIYNDFLWLGLNYRWDAALGAFAQFMVTPQFKIGVAGDFGIQKIGVAGDFGIQKLRNYNSGTYEVLLSYDFTFKKKGILSPRYF